MRALRLLIPAFLLVACIFPHTTAAAPPNAAVPLSFRETDARQRTRVHLVRFTTLSEPLEYLHFYRFNQELHPYYDDDYPQPEEALQLNSSEVNDCWLQLAGGVPHSLRWEIEVNVRTSGVVVVPEVDGIVFQRNGTLPGLAVAEGWHRVSMDRHADRLAVRVDEDAEAVTFVPPTTHVPLRLTVRREPFVWLRGSALYAAPADPWRPAETAAPTPETGAVTWREVYRQAFDGPESLRDFTIEHTNNTVSWLPDDRCLRLNAATNGLRDDCFATLNRNLPGDIRIRFRARNVPHEDQFFGVFVSCRRVFPHDDGYYCEWNRGWLRRIKKVNVQRSFVRPQEEEVHTPYWADYRLERIGGTITMYKNDRLSLTWTDPDPIQNPAYGKFAFYVIGQPMDFDDLVIDHNARDVAAEEAAARLAASNAVAGTASATATRPRDPTAADTVLTRPSPAAVQPTSGGSVVPLAAPMISDLAVANDTISFRWAVQAGAEYDVETCNDLTSPAAWTTVPGWAGVRTRDTVLIFTAPISTHGHSFYRVVARPVAP